MGKDSYRPGYRKISRRLAQGGAEIKQYSKTYRISHLINKIFCFAFSYKQLIHFYSSKTSLDYQKISVADIGFFVA
jgi:hypothetical protein